jgi:predicted Fe-Mo cluster-binding NifX family protein
MKIAISTDGKYVSQHFGRCATYTLVDIEEGKVVKKEEVNNPGHSPGSIPKYLHDKGVKVIVCGGMGARAEGFFGEFGIETVTGIEGFVDEVILKLKENKLVSKESLCTPGLGKGYGVEKEECDHLNSE